MRGNVLKQELCNIRSFQVTPKHFKTMTDHDSGICKAVLNNLLSVENQEPRIDNLASGGRQKKGMCKLTMSWNKNVRSARLQPPILQTKFSQNI